MAAAVTGSHCLPSLEPQMFSALVYRYEGCLHKETAAMSEMLESRVLAGHAM